MEHTVGDQIPYQLTDSVARGPVGCNLPTVEFVVLACLAVEVIDQFLLSPTRQTEAQSERPPAGPVGGKESKNTRGDGAAHADPGYTCTFVIGVFLILPSEFGFAQCFCADDDGENFVPVYRAGIG